MGISCGTAAWKVNSASSPNFCKHIRPTGTVRACEGASLEAMPGEREIYPPLSGAALSSTPTLSVICMDSDIFSSIRGLESASPSLETSRVSLYLLMNCPAPASEKSSLAGGLRTYQGLRTPIWWSSANCLHPFVTFVERSRAIFSCNECPQRRISLIEETS